MNPLLQRAFSDELGKIALTYDDRVGGEDSEREWETDRHHKYAASRVDQIFRKASPAKAKAMAAKLYRLEGVRPPMMSTKGYEDPKYREKIIQSLRNYRRAKVPEVAPRGSPLWRAAMKDIKAGRVNTFESGLNEAQGRNILRRGASSPADLPHGANMKKVRDLLHRKVEKIDNDAWNIKERKARRKAREIAQRVRTKSKAGIYAADHKTVRTGSYAARAMRTGDPKRGPAALRFELPQSMAQAGSQTELRVPRDFLRRWGRKLRVETVSGDKVLARGGPNFPDALAANFTHARRPR